MEPKQKDAYWFSKISNFLLCPKKFERVHINDESEPAGKKSTDLLFGSIFHMAMENLTNGGEEYLNIFETYWGSVKDRDDVAWGRYGWEWLNQMGPRMLTRYAKVYQPLIEPVIVERRLFGSCSEHKFEGTPDLIGYYNGVLSVIDFKTSGYRYDKDKILIADQLVGYSHLYKDTPEFEEHGEAKQIVYFVFCKDKGSIQKPIILPLTEELESGIMANTTAVIDQIGDAKEYPMNMGSCIRGTIKCPFFEACHGKNRENT